MTWPEDVLARASLADAAAALGLVDSRGGWTPCPSCGAEARGSSDRRGPVGLRGDGRGWRCHRCRAGGDVLTLAALALTGEAKPSGDGWGRVRAYCAGRGWCSGDGTGAPLPALPRAAAPAPVPPKRPPADEVAAVWASCVGVTLDREVAAWLRGRGLDPATVEDLDLCRALPAGAAAPAWAGTSRGSWARSGHRLLTPLVGASGRVEALRARAVVPGAERKALAAVGYQVAGLLFACQLARLMLAGGVLGDGTPAAAQVLEVGLVVVEGEPDFLSWATRYGTDGGLELAPAVVGVESGAWTDEVAARVPDGARVVVRTHGDESGDRYARAVVETLGNRCEVSRAAHGAAA